MSLDFKAGVWKTNITPALGVSITGGFTPVYAADIIDDIYANAIVIDDGCIEIAIVSVDVCLIPNEVFSDIINIAQEMSGINKNNIIIAATHTHSGPGLGGFQEDIGIPYEGYLEHFKKCVATSIAMAKKRKQPARIRVSKGTNDKQTFNRRLKKPDGSIIMNWTDKAFLQDCIETGPVDPELISIIFEDNRGKPFAFIVNYATHNCVLGIPAISREFTGCISDKLAQLYGESMVTLFLTDTCGNVNCVDYRNTEQRFGEEALEKIGTSLVGTILESMSDEEYVDTESESGHVEVKISSKLISIPDRPWRDYDTKKDITFGMNDEANEEFLIQYRKEREISAGIDIPLNEVDIHAVMIGKSIGIVTNPGELFVEYGLDIKSKSPFKYTIISELTNGYVGYICTKKAFEEGGYEVRKTNHTSHLDINAGEIIVESSIDLINALNKE